MDVLKILRKLKSKKSSGHDGISSEVLRLGAETIAGPLTLIINTSIATSKFPSKWKESKVCPVYKKGDRQMLKNYRPVSLLSVPGMVCERVITIQAEMHFEDNRILQDFQFGFRKFKSTISEMLTLFDSLLEAKEKTTSKSSTNFHKRILSSIKI